MLLLAINHAARLRVMLRIVEPHRLGTRPPLAAFAILPVNLEGSTREPLSRALGAYEEAEQRLVLERRGDVPGEHPSALGVRRTAACRTLEEPLFVLFALAGARSSRIVCA